MRFMARSGTGAASCGCRSIRGKSYAWRQINDNISWILLYPVTVAMGSCPGSSPTVTGRTGNTVNTDVIRMPPCPVRKGRPHRLTAISGHAVTGVATAGGVAHRRRLGMTRHAVWFDPDRHRIG
jgi:hypothetical protein